MTAWNPGDPDRRSHGNPGLSGDVGELRGVLQQHLTQQMQLWSRFQDELREQVHDRDKRFEEVHIKLGNLLDWKAEMTGGMRVAVLIWRAWAGAVTLWIAWQSVIKQALKGGP